MRLKGLLQLLILFCFSILPSLVNGANNILLVIVDDLNIHLRPYLSSEHPLTTVDYTPNIQKFAKDSITFHRAYAQNAACNPSRAAILTSKTPITLQLFNKSPLYQNNPSVKTLPGLFRKTHYVFGIGKVFEKEWFDQFDKFRTFLSQNNLCSGNSDYCIKPSSQLVDQKIANIALNMIDNSPKTKPFFGLIGFHRPHWKYSFDSDSLQTILPSYSDILIQTQLSQTQFGAIDPPNPETNGAPFISGVTSKPPAAYETTVAKAAQRRKWVAASTQWIDKCLGRVLEGLKQRNYYNNTIIIFTSDNGVMLMDRGQSGKSVLFNQARRVPLLIHHPKYPNSFGKTSGASFDLMDILPTLLESEGYSETIAQINGISQIPLFKLLQSTSNNYYEPSLKLAAMTQETRCARSRTSLLATPIGKKYEGIFQACHQISLYDANAADIFGISFQTTFIPTMGSFSYIEWRVAQTINGRRVPRWDAAGLWGRELYDFSKDKGLVTMNGVEFEAKNLASCHVSCFPRSLNTPTIPASTKPTYRLPLDAEGVEYYPPDLQNTNHSDLVQRLSLAMRSLVRDNLPICSGHGLAHPVTGVCDICIQGWTGTNCDESSIVEFM